MRTINRKDKAKSLQLLAEEHSIPNSYYDLATARGKAFETWLRREGRALARYAPEVYPQGSFRYGTVKSAKLVFDLDLVIELTRVSKHELSQAWLKRLIGEEVKAYVKEHGMKYVPEPSRRCWKLRYAEQGGIEFYIDLLPALSEDETLKTALARLVDPPKLARFAIVYTDTKHAAHHMVSPDWPMSNPEGFARWFLDQARPAAKIILRERVDILPANQWDTPLQIVVRLLKHHRDMWFENDPDLKPASIIITTLAAHAYDEQTDLVDAFEAIVDGMPLHIVNGEVRNPSNPGENFADKWAENPDLRAAFDAWHAALRRDLDRIGDDLTIDNRRTLLEDRFGVSIDRDRFGVPAAVPAIAVARDAACFRDRRAHSERLPPATGRRAVPWIAVAPGDRHPSATEPRRLLRGLRGSVSLSLCAHREIRGRAVAGATAQRARTALGRHATPW